MGQGTVTRQAGALALLELEVSVLLLSVLDRSSATHLKIGTRIERTSTRRKS